jgi:uncharacterized protein YyaL (SSP411 family)
MWARIFNVVLEQCIIVRQDRKPLTRETIETIYRFTEKLIEGAGYPEYDGWAPIRSFVTPASFQFFSRDYYKSQHEKGRPGFDSFFKPL